LFNYLSETCVTSLKDLLNDVSPHVTDAGQAIFEGSKDDIFRNKFYREPTVVIKKAPKISTSNDCAIRSAETVRESNIATVMNCFVHIPCRG
jgi:hypothetical protein